MIILSAMMKLRASQERFVPRHTRMSEQTLLGLKSFLRKSRRLFVVTGAGVSTESGIQDYRSDEVGLYSTTTHRPTRIAEFLRSPVARQKYWARNSVAWPLFRAFSPNVSHHFLATLERKGRLYWLVTQNVDRLHHKAGATRVTELMEQCSPSPACPVCTHSQETNCKLISLHRILAGILHQKVLPQMLMCLCLMLP